MAMDDKNLELPPDPFTSRSRLLELWSKPLQPLLPEVSAAIKKPLAEVTLHELLACACVFGYIFSSVMVAEMMLLNIARVAIRGR